MSKHLFAPLAVVALGALVTACSASPDSDATSSEDLAASAPIGHYLLAENDPQDFIWVNEINLHHDGTFDGNFGSGVSNLSGHFFLANGTYALTQSSKGRVLALTYSFDGAPSGTSTYLVKTTAHGIQLKPTDDANEPWFAMDSAPAPVALHFDANGNVSADRALHAGDTALIRYAAARAKCSGKNASVGVFAAIDSPQPQFVSSPTAVNGFYDFLVPIGTGKELSVWFESSDGPSCHAWDSNASKNFTFAIE
jgi:hypothetical protein